jgi:protein-S-isoprenylcysteine O-methyltransferase Ste14
VTLRQISQRVRVPAGFVLAPLLLLSAKPTALTLAVGATVAVLGLAIRAWASGYLRKNETLTTSGPYSRTRNPLYLGTFLLGTGVAIGGGTVWFVALFVALYALIYVPVMLAEAQTMQSLFPDEYPDYERSVPLFLPRLRQYRDPRGLGAQSAEQREAGGFEASLYLKHREYRAALGLVAVYSLLMAKMFIK